MIEMLGNLFIILLFQSLYLRGIPFILNVGIKISPVDIILLIFLFVHFISVFIGKSKLKFPIPLNYLLYFFLILSTIEIFSVIFIDKGSIENLTLALSIYRNFTLIYLMVNFIVPSIKTATFMIIVAVINSIIAIFFYFKALNNFSIIINTPDLWEPGVFYTLDSGLLRLQGLSDDPNFFFIINFICIPVSLALFMIQKSLKRKILYLIAFFLLLSANILTFSRTGFIILLLYFTFLFSIYFRKYYRHLIILLFLLLASLLPFLDVFKSRFISGIETGGSQRLYLWNVALKGFIESPIWGQGGRYTLKVAGNYTHNDLLEILSSHGLIGLIPVVIMYIFLMFVFSSKSKIINKYCPSKVAVLYNYIFLILIVYTIAHIFFSIFYNPYIWFIVGMLITLKERCIVRRSIYVA